MSTDTTANVFASTPSASQMANRHLLSVVRATTQSFELARRIYQDRFAPDFTPFQFIQPDELKLSRIIAWLLDPSANHGQGAHFLKAFVSALGTTWPEDVCEAAHVRLEVLTHRLSRRARRIDILITSGEYAIGIENKPWAADQDAQLADYLSHLRSEYDYPVLLYLSGQTDRASDGSLSQLEREEALSQKLLVEWTYRSLSAWLQSVEASCKADRVRAFLREFTTYIQTEFEGAAHVSETSHLVSQIVSDDLLLSPALDVIQAGEAVRLALIGQLADQLETETHAKGWRVVCALDSPPYANASIFFPEFPDYPFSIEFQSSPFKRLIFGVKNYELGGRDDETVHQRLAAAFGSAGRSKHWPWARSARREDQLLALDDNWQTHKEPWLGIRSGATTSIIIKCAQQFQIALSGPS